MNAEMNMQTHKHQQKQQQKQDSNKLMDRLLTIARAPTKNSQQKQ